MTLPKDTRVVPAELSKRPLDRVVRELFQLSWAEARGAIKSGKVFVTLPPSRQAGADSAAEIPPESWTEEQRPVAKGATIAIRPDAPRPRVARRAAFEDSRLLHLDAALVVVDKPAGMSTVPFGEEPDDGTLAALVRDVLKNKLRGRVRGMAPLGVVHRLDKETTGAIVFARSVEAKKYLAQQFRDHSIHRRYLALVNGVITQSQTFRSHLVPDRGDGLRGSARHKNQGGQLAITHIEPLETLAGATLIACQLETGRTHQIRVHLSEAGHPIIGERVYIRRYPGPRIEAARQMLHAVELGFVHPTNEEEVSFTSPLPEDFETLLRSLRRSH